MSVNYTLPKMSVGKGQVLSSTYRWEIANYSGLETGKSISSPTFNVLDTSWHLRLYPNGGHQDAGDCISLFLCLKKKIPVGSEIRARFAFSVMKNKNEVILTSNSTETVSFANEKGWGTSFPHESVLPLNEITILCEVMIEEAKLYKTIITINSDKLEHFEGYKKLLKSLKFSDVKITVEGKEIPAHKMVLAANSTVFAAMFEHKMRENEENTVAIEDISYKVFDELLTFLYTGECTIYKDSVSELFEAADKYQLLKLKDTCEEELCQNIAVENVIALLQLADMHSAERLKKKAIEFVTLHGKEIVRRPEFDSMRSLPPDIFREVFQEVFDRMN